MAKFLASLLGLLCVTEYVTSRPADEWNAQAQQSLQEALRLQNNMAVAKNVILFLGDGMGVSTVTAARLYKAQAMGQPGMDTPLHFEAFPYVALSKNDRFTVTAARLYKAQAMGQQGVDTLSTFEAFPFVFLSKTYNVDRQTADSAGTATAFLCGVKANMATVGLDSSVTRGQCDNLPAAKVSSILHWSHLAGKATGLVTTSRVTHATPAASYAQSPDRDWEGDVDMADLPDPCKANVKDISAQLVEDNPFINVIMGGGRRTFLPHDETDPQTGQVNAKKGRRDGKNLIEVWQQSRAAGARAHYVWNKPQLDAVDFNNTDFLLGLFSSSHMQYELKRDEQQQPSLAHMVRAALSVLQHNPHGFFLLVEGARIDHAHHDNYGQLALADTVAFDDAVAVAKEMTGEDTLMVVTADHSHVFNIAGYPQRGNDIFGLVSPVKEAEAPFDGMPYTTLVYANGPGPGRINLTDVDTKSVEHQQPVAVRMPWETHGGEDVAVYASGPRGHVLHGVQEQNYLAHAMAFASCVGPYTNHHHCKDRPHSASTRLHGNAAMASLLSFIVVVRVWRGVTSVGL